MINELLSSEFINDIISNQYSFYVLIAVSVLLLYLIANAFKGSDPQDEITRREIENKAYLMGVTYLLSKDTDKAIEEFIRAVKVNSDTVATYFALGTLYRNKGEYSRAIRIHQSIIARPNIDSDTRAQAMYNVGLDYKKAGMVQKGIDAFESVSKNEKYRLEALQSLQILYEDMKEWDNAIKIVKEIERFESSNKSNIIAHLYTEKAKGVFEAGDLSEAKKLFKKAISLRSQCIDAYLHLGDLYFVEGEYMKSIHTWKQVFEVNSYFTHLAYPRLEQAYFNLNKYDSIEKLLTENLNKNNEDAYCHLELGRYYFNKGEVEKAVYELNEALRIDPEFIDAKKEIATIYLQNDMIDEIKKEFKDILQALPSKYSTYICTQCGYSTSEILWRCPQCRQWGTIIPKDKGKRR